MALISCPDCTKQISAAGSKPECSLSSLGTHQEAHAREDVKIGGCDSNAT